MGAKEVFRQYAEALDRGDIDGMAALVSDDFRREGAGLDGIGKPSSWWP
jgi:ketosteroid isomerase-like protein